MAAGRRAKVKDEISSRSVRKKENEGEKGKERKGTAMEIQWETQFQPCQEGEMWATRTPACLMTITDVCNITTLRMAKDKHIGDGSSIYQQRQQNKKGGYKKIGWGERN